MIHFYLTLAYSAVRAEMETRNGELARVQRERGKTTEGVSKCEGRARELIIIVESGWNVWVWLMGVVSRRWVWLVGVGGMYECG